jgi:vacuolar-type H+-ATPase subunit C/Vma6
MEDSGASAYVYAKASALLSKMYIGPRAVKLFNVKSLPELWTFVFKTEVPLVPQTILGEMIEEEAEKWFIKQYISLVEIYENPNKLLTDLLLFYDIENLKEIGAALCSKERTMPHIIELNKFSVLNYKAWPDVAGITKGSPLSWYNNVPDEHAQQFIDARLDNQYVRMIWESVNEVSGDARDSVINFIRKDFVMMNIIWALRLKVYYEMPHDQILDHLAGAGGKACSGDPLSGPAVEILDKAVDSYADWENWKYAKMLNPHEEGVVWRIDPRWIENVYKAGMYRRAETMFHANPLSELALVAWFKIKQHECDIIRTAAEGIRLNVDSVEAKKFAGITIAEE